MHRKSEIFKLRLQSFSSRSIIKTWIFKNTLDGENVDSSCESVYCLDGENVDSSCESVYCLLFSDKYSVGKYVYTAKGG